jgi:hypothetical protein
MEMLLWWWEGELLKAQIPSKYYSYEKNVLQQSGSPTMRDTRVHLLMTFEI